MNSNNKHFAKFACAIGALFVGAMMAAPSQPTPAAEHYVSFVEAFNTARYQNYDSKIGMVTILDPKANYGNDMYPGLAPACLYMNPDVEIPKGLEAGSKFIVARRSECIYLKPGQSVRIDKYNRKNLAFICVTPVGARECNWTLSERVVGFFYSIHDWEQTQAYRDWQKGEEAWLQAHPKQ
jgi:hypothetical protein